MYSLKKNWLLTRRWWSALQYVKFIGKHIISITYPPPSHNFTHLKKLVVNQQMIISASQWDKFVEKLPDYWNSVILRKIPAGAYGEQLRQLKICKPAPGGLAIKWFRGIWTCPGRNLAAAKSLRKLIPERVWKLSGAWCLCPEIEFALKLLNYVSRGRDCRTCTKELYEVKFQIGLVFDVRFVVVVVKTRLLHHGSLLTSLWLAV